MDIEELFKIHHDKFKPLYSDLTAETGQKDPRIEQQIEAAMSHLSTGFASGDSEELKRQIDAAAAHVHRAALDAIKRLWLAKQTKANKIRRSRRALKLALVDGASAEDFVRRHNQGKALVKEARRLDDNGHPADAVLDCYYRATAKLESAMSLVNEDKLAMVFADGLWITIRSQALSFMTGLVTGVVSNYLWVRFIAPLL